MIIVLDMSTIFAIAIRGVWGVDLHTIINTATLPCKEVCTSQYPTSRYVLNYFEIQN